MRNNSKDATIKRNYIQVYRHYIEEYEAVKRGEHAQYRRVGEFYTAHKLQRQTFLKYYGRYRNSGGDVSALAPRKRGARWRTRRTALEIEEMVLEWRARGCSRFEIHSILKPKLGASTPATSTIYAILKRYGKNRMTPPLEAEKRRYIRENPGELAHIDCYHIAKDTIMGVRESHYLVAVVDDTTRLAWVEMSPNLTALKVMFATLRCLNHMAERFEIRFQEALTDNGPEFGPAASKSKHNHAFECMLVELGIKHRNTKPYRPQTNGKVERFWRTLNQDMIDETHFESIEHFKQELADYLIYYNTMRPHQGINGQTPLQKLQSCQRII